MDVTKRIQNFHKLNFDVCFGFLLVLQKHDGVVRVGGLLKLKLPHSQ